MGIAVSDIGVATEFYEKAFGYHTYDGPYHDPIQQVHVAFLRRDAHLTTNTSGHELVAALGPTLELISPAADNSPISLYLRKEVGLYHTCFEVDDIHDALSACRKAECIVVANPAPAAAFDGRKIAWVFSPTRQLIEVLARD